MSKMSSFPCCRLMGPAQRPCLPSVLAKIQISAAELKNQRRIKKKNTKLEWFYSSESKLIVIVSLFSPFLFDSSRFK